MSISDEILSLTAEVRFQSRECYTLAAKAAQMAEQHVGLNSKNETFEEVSRPLIKWINDNYHLHVTVIVDSSSAEVLEGIKAFKTREYIK